MLVLLSEAKHLCGSLGSTRNKNQLPGCFASLSMTLATLFRYRRKCLPETTRSHHARSELRP